MATTEAADSSFNSAEELVHPKEQNITSSASSHPSPTNSDPQASLTSTPRLQALEAKTAALRTTLASLESQRSALVAQATSPSNSAPSHHSSEEERTGSALANASAAIKHHIALLQKYNEIKDIGQGLMGFLADERGVRIADVMEDFGVDEKD